MHQPSTSLLRKQTLPHILCAAALVFSMTLAPLTAYAADDIAADQSPQTSEQQQPAPAEPAAPMPPAQTGPTTPTGADAKTYVQNPSSGVWENDQYIWDPTTGQTKPKQQQEYSYNPATGAWDTNEWKYDAATGQYLENTISTPSLPNGAKTSQPATTSDATGVGSSLSTASNGDSSSSAANSISGNGANNSTTTNRESNGLFDLFYNSSISNKLDSSAITGDALVAGNTLAGNALTGSALAIANLINLLQSSWDYMSHGGLNTFMANMYGDVYGDLMLDPGQLPTSTSTASGESNVDVNVSGSGSINNDVDLDAQSGNATVKNNTEAGSATSGEAHAIANLINSIGSSISSGQSFLGMLNIFGNFNGDVLVPTNLINLLAKSPDAVATIELPTSSTDIQATTNQSITNDVNSNASTGQASTTGNTAAGDAISGNASTKVNILNLTGRQIVGQNAMLVFVNVLGNWVGLIVDAPVGSRSAALVDGSSTSSALTKTNVISNEDLTINNDLDLSSNSGNATVSDNTKAGNATTGNASTSANIVNITNSNLTFNDWFGILFINIFGDWTGSFGIDTDAGEAPAVNQPPQLTVNPESAAQGVTERTLGFAQNIRSFSSSSSNNVTETSTDVASDNTGKVMSIEDAQVNNTSAKRLPNTVESSNSFLFAAVGTMIGLSILGGERMLSNRKIR